MAEPPDRPFDSRDFTELSSEQSDRINHSAIDLYARQLAEERERSRKLAEALEEIDGEFIDNPNGTVSTYGGPIRALDNIRATARTTLAETRETEWDSHE